MRRLLLETSVPKFYMLMMIGISVLMLGGYFSYAMFTVQKEKSNAISIVTGNLTGTLLVDGASSNKLVVPASTTKTFTVVLSNNNARKARYNFYYTGTLASNISAGYIVEEGSNTPPKETGVILEATGTAGSSASYKIKIKNNSSNSITITLGYQVGLENINLALPSNSNLFTVEDKDGEKAQHVKIMRDASIGNYSWDNTTIENEEGKNRWSDARLNYLLNPGHEGESIGGSLYWNRGSGTCYSGQYNDRASCNFTSTGLTSVAKNKIEEVKWYLGGYGWGETQSVEAFHEAERGMTIFSSSNYPRDASWIGSVGLMYPSDYGYTYSLGIDATCYGDLYNCSQKGGGVPTSSWMYKSTYYQWTLSSHALISFPVFYVHGLGHVDGISTYETQTVRPIVYLKSDIKLASGSGTSIDPFQILS